MRQNVEFLVFFLQKNKQGKKKENRIFKIYFGLNKKILEFQIIEYEMNGNIVRDGLGCIQEKIVKSKYIRDYELVGVL